jgi:hyaluronoglucosaminidase
MSGVLNQFSCGVIEGFFGKTWSWNTRQTYTSFLKENGFNFYIYAPKADKFIRELWQQNWSIQEQEELMRLGDAYHREGLYWGIGLSPFEIYLNYDDETISALEKRIEYLNGFQLDILAILFDDMKGDFYHLASLQAEIIDRVLELSTATTFIMCPTYYTDDPILDKLFGERPPDYLETLGRLLDPKVYIFWTGPKVCSKAYPESHLKEVWQRLGRRPFIWDNYPVNDGPRMSRYLHLRAFENRPYNISDWASGHVINPMNQAYLSQIPIKTLSTLYQQKECYSAPEALVDAAKKLCGDELADSILGDISIFQDEGLDGIDHRLKEDLIRKYEIFHSPYSREIVSWLKDEYLFSPECLTDQ